MSLKNCVRIVNKVLRPFLLQRFLSWIWDVQDLTKHNNGGTFQNPTLGSSSFPFMSLHLLSVSVCSLCLVSNPPLFCDDKLFCFSNRDSLIPLWFWSHSSCLLFQTSPFMVSDWSLSCSLVVHMRLDCTNTSSLSLAFAELDSLRVY